MDDSSLDAAEATPNHGAIKLHVAGGGGAS